MPCTTLPALTTTHGLQIVREFLPGFNPAAAPPAPRPPAASTSGESAETVAVRGGGGGGARAALPDSSAVMDFSTIEDLYALGTAALLLVSCASLWHPRTHARAHTVGSPIPPLRRSASPLVRHYYKRR